MAKNAAEAVVTVAVGGGDGSLLLVSPPPLLLPLPSPPHTPIGCSDEAKVTQSKGPPPKSPQAPLPGAGTTAMREQSPRCRSTPACSLSKKASPLKPLAKRKIRTTRSTPSPPALLLLLLLLLLLPPKV